MDLVSDINIENAAPLALAQGPARKPKKHHKPQEDCQNCGAKLVGEYCHECGQHGHVHRSVGHVVEEVLHGITHFDSRTWRSLPMLAFRPGTLTRNYVMGKRARYVPPFAMFLSSIFAMFLVFAFSGGPNLVSNNASTKAESVATARERLADEEAELRVAQSEVSVAEKQLADLRAAAETDPGEIGVAEGQVGAAMGQVSGSQARVDKAKADLAAAIAKPEKQAGPSGSGAKATFTFDSPDEQKKALEEIAANKAKATKDGNLVEARALAAAEKLAKAAPSSPNAPESAKAGESILDMMKDSMRRGDFIRTPWPELNEKIKYKTENPDLFIYKIQNTAYKFSFLLVPLSLPFIWIMLFWKRNVTMFDHAVFALYSLSFVSFLFLFVSLSAHWVPVGTVSGIALMLLPVHIFFQFKGAYQLKWFSAFWRTALFCGIFSWVVILAFFLTIIALGVTG